VASGEALGRQQKAAAGGPARPGSRMRWVPGSILAVIVLTYLIPLGYLLITALRSTADFNRNPVGLPSGLDFGNLANAWAQGNFSEFALNSVLYSVVGATVGTFGSVLLAFPIARRYVRWSGFWQLLFMIALFLPNALVTQFQLMLALGLYDNRFGYILLLVGQFGVGPLILIGYFRSIPITLDEAAAMDGCGYWSYIWRFILPLSRPALVTVFVLQAISIWNEIILATIMLSDPSKAPISKGLLAFAGPYGTNVPLLAAATSIVAIPLILLYVFLQRFIIAGALGGSFKE
jgi:raffinose/stachyose/melibiose transport system permease protein